MAAVDPSAEDVPGAGARSAGALRARTLFARNRTAWEDWSRLDPLWAVVTDPTRRHGRWDVEEFFASGEATVADLWDTAASFGLPRARRHALDFGCGVGRLTRALGTRVEHVVGLDISEGMVELARAHNREQRNVEFSVHHRPDLGSFADGSFDVVCCLLVLQHIPRREQAERFLCELVRVLAEGGVLMLQLMTQVPPPPARRGIRSRLRLRTRLGGGLRLLGVEPEVLGRWLRWEPDMPLVPIGDDRARRLVAAGGAKVVWSCPRREGDVEDCLYIVTR